MSPHRGETAKVWKHILVPVWVTVRTVSLTSIQIILHLTQLLWTTPHFHSSCTGQNVVWNGSISRRSSAQKFWIIFIFQKQFKKSFFLNKINANFSTNIFVILFVCWWNNTAESLLKTLQTLDLCCLPMQGWDVLYCYIMWTNLQNDLLWTSPDPFMPWVELWDYHVYSL